MLQVLCEKTGYYWYASKLSRFDYHLDSLAFDYPFKNS